MIYMQLFFTFFIVGLFTFGGGYAMLSLIQNEVVVNHAWITAQEFTDMVAISQMTPGPIGINSATYVGYAVTGNVFCRISGQPCYNGHLQRDPSCGGLSDCCSYDKYGKEGKAQFLYRIIGSSYCAAHNIP